MNDDLGQALRRWNDDQTRAAAHETDLMASVPTVRRRAARRRATISASAGLAAAALVGGAAVGTTGLLGGEGSTSLKPAAPTPTERVTSAAPEPLGPIATLLAEHGLGDRTDQVRAAELARQEVIAACMADAGFERVPHVADEPDAGDVEPVDHEQLFGAEPGTVAWAEIYGYNYLVADPTTAIVNGVGEPDVDPNDAILVGLTQDEKDAYVEALTGAPPGEEQWDDAVGNVMDGKTRTEWGGCEGEGYEQVPDPDAVAAERFPELEAAIAGIRAEVAADPRRAEIDDRWAACMAGAGFPDLSAQHEGMNLVVDRAADLTAAALADAGVTVDLPEFLADATVDATERARLNARIQDELQALVPWEIEIAVADATCAEDVEYWETVDEITWDHEQEVLEAHADELDAWLAVLKG